LRSIYDPDSELNFVSDLQSSRDAPGSTSLIFWWLIGGDWRKVPFDDQRRGSSNMAAMAAILDLVSIDYLTNACVDWSDFLVAHWG
jgi:hypothetical protein